MNTKFILHGGFNKDKADEDNHVFYSEILKDTPDRLKILLVPFAKDADRIVPATEKISKEFRNSSPDKNLQIDIATESDFLYQLENTDVIYFHGGRTLKLLESLRKFPQLGELLEGKIVAGESAGANIFAKFCYSPNADVVTEGLGILPIKIIPHYIEKYEDKLNNIGSGLELVLLAEYQYKVFLV